MPLLPTLATRSCTAGLSEPLLLLLPLTLSIPSGTGIAHQLQYDSTASHAARTAALKQLQVLRSNQQRLRWKLVMPGYLYRPQERSSSSTPQHPLLLNHQEGLVPDRPAAGCSMRSLDGEARSRSTAPPAAAWYAGRQEPESIVPGGCHAVRLCAQHNTAL
jgi:hypothetical protein